MQRRIFLLLLAIIGFHAQSQVSPALEEKLSEAGNRFLPIRVEFATTVDFEALEAWFTSKQTPARERPRIVNRLLMKQAQTTQAGARTLLRTFDENEVRSIHSFYITNVMVMVVKPEAIFALAQLPDVTYVDWAGDAFLAHDPVIESRAHKTAAVNGTEPGLRAVNAPAMWELGYTGRGRVVYNYDTGVWPTHPAFKDRFLGNFAPLSQSWYGLLSDYPDGRISNHGTHTLGTIAGLDTTTNDTIGVAFGAYWMANDFVASTVADLPPLARMIEAFEWALNPDGDTATSDDVPDVINNSWRWRDDPDTVHCGGFVVQLMNAIEAAGIANVFSGGNSGPNNTTVNSPQRINTSVVNTFSVGSVDGNQPFPHPISSFSTRGPTQCLGSGSLSIHPEVVAPGQNVRSAWGTNAYHTISGTSMAAPHVSGAVLLLKEAFPQLTGAQLLQALYTTAIDMGVSGEDNTYGNGLIDVHAAYQLLTLSHTPVNPNKVHWDVAIKEVSSAEGGEVVCKTPFNPGIVVQNLGDSAIRTVRLTYWLDGVMGTSSPVSISTPNLQARGDVDTLFIPGGVDLPMNRDYVLTVQVELNKTEYDVINNQRIMRFNKRGTAALPFYEDFEAGISEAAWYLKNEDALISWDTVSIQGWPGNNTAAYLNFSDYLPRESQRDELWGAALPLPDVPVLGLSFDLAYQSPGTIALTQDTFKIYASTDCGKTYPHLLYNKAGADLGTTGVLGGNFEPVSRADWRREHIDLSPFAGREILLSFVGINRKGNNLYLDNISVYEGLWDPFSLPEARLNVFSLHPNPAKEAVQISSLLKHENPLRVQLIDANGRKVGQPKTIKANDYIEVSKLTGGLYFIKISQGKRVEYLRFVKH